MISQIKGSRLILSDIVVFIFVLAALACVASPHFKRVKERRYTLNAKAKLKTIYDAQISYYRLNSRYADSLDELAVIDPKVDEGLSDMTGGRKSDRDWNYYIVLVGGHDFKIYAKIIPGRGFSGKLSVDSLGKYAGDLQFLNW